MHGVRPFHASLQIWLQVGLLATVRVAWIGSNNGQHCMGPRNQSTGGKCLDWADTWQQPSMILIQEAYEDSEHSLEYCQAYCNAPSWTRQDDK